ncbi:hypothetical protein [Trinickia dinghuensis]|uniref:Uncharacterized protein n=1 Tax=Trinickia dinghuensis TaxID=2291023 RepID=A0A3D8JQP4_9BURK|nr:hypothetical protein [Trinickia dinghuensis]RDU95357.1 hypothetical protein DWV00_29390 [Trinickia dinghuensis]
MAEDALDPALRQIAEKYLNRPLEANEIAELLKLQQRLRARAPSSAASASDAAEQGAANAAKGTGGDAQ